MDSYQIRVVYHSGSHMVATRTTEIQLRRILVDHRNDAQELLVRYSQSCSLQNLEATVMIVASRRLIG